MSATIKEVLRYHKSVADRAAMRLHDRRCSAHTRRETEMELEFHDQCVKILEAAIATLNSFQVASETTVWTAVAEVMQSRPFNAAGETAKAAFLFPNGKELAVGTLLYVGPKK